MADTFLRCSQLVGSFGPGSLVDFPDRSVIIGGLSDWDRQGGVEVQEPRLAAKLRQALGVGNLQLFTPPAYDDAPGAPRFGVAARIFPTWFVTQNRAANPGPFGRRRLIGIDGSENNGLIYRDPDDSRRKQLTPIRFVCACRKGHTDDVDWRTFVHRGKTECRRTLWIEERGTSGEVTDTWIGCDCGQQRQLYEALDLKTVPLGYCNGKRPWLGYFGQSEECHEPNRLLVRSASNAYFAELMSVISLPDKNEAVTARLDEIWDLIKDVDAIADLDLLRKLQAPVRAALEGIASGEVLELIRQRRAGGVDDRPVKEAEFDILASGQNVIGRDASDSTFFAETLDRPKWDPQGDPLLAPVERLVLIHRLREVVAQVGFTRFEPPAPEIDGELDMKVERQMLDTEIKWLPAVEHRGEGVFIQLRASAIDAWLRKPAVAEHVNRLMRGFDLWRAERRSDRMFPGAPYVLLHSLSHLLLAAIALDCGYPASSLRERVYALPGRYGILIHTGTSDAEGTLGGLVEAGRWLGDHLRKALETGRLCSNDPVCADHYADDTNERRFQHGAACHGCLLIAETSCEQRNDLLDRALVVPTVATQDAAFFGTMKI
jgi:hypothetical protein